MNPNYWLWRNNNMLDGARPWRGIVLRRKCGWRKRRRGHRQRPSSGWSAELRQGLRSCLRRCTTRAWVVDRTETIVKDKNERRMTEQDVSHRREDFFPPFLALVLVNVVAEIQDICARAWSLSTRRRDSRQDLRILHETPNKPTSAVTPPANKAAPKAEFGAFKV